MSEYFVSAQLPYNSSFGFFLNQPIFPHQMHVKLLHTTLTNPCSVLDNLTAILFLPRPPCVPSLTLALCHNAPASGPAPVTLPALGQHRSSIGIGVTQIALVPGVGRLACCGPGRWVSTSCATGPGRWVSTSCATGTGPIPTFSLSIVLLSSSLFASKYTDLVPTRLLPGIGNVLDSTVQSPPLASTQTGTGPTPRFPDPTGITGTRIMFLPRGPRKQLGLLAKALLPPLQQVSQPMAQSCLFLRGTTSLWNSCMRGRRQ